MHSIAYFEKNVKLPLDKPKKACYNSCIIKLHKETPALWADASMKILSADYPFVFERTDGKETLVIAINPSSKECSTPSYKEVIDEWSSGKSN